VSLSEQVDAAMIQERLVATLAGGFGLLALVLACIGAYGLLAFTIAGRTKELAIRMAVGSAPRALIGRVLGSALRPLVLGLLLGLPAAALVTRAVRSMLFELDSSDPLAVSAAVLVLSLASLTAAWLAARRAARIEPVVALRQD